MMKPFRFFGLLGTCVVGLGLTACGPRLDKVLTSGSYDGFTIGATGEQTYQRARELRISGEARGFSMPGYASGRTVQEAEGHALSWNRWVVVWSGGKSVDLELEGDHIVAIWGPRSTGWGPYSDTVVAVGMHADTAFQRLKRLIQTDSSLGSAVFHLIDKNFEKPFDPFMVDSARYPAVTPDRVHWWITYREKLDDNSIHLYFEDGRLSKIHRIKWNSWLFD